MRIKKVLVAGACVVVPSIIVAQSVEKNTADEIVVSATRTSVPFESVADSVSVITAQDIKQKQCTTVLDALKTVPGLHITQNGGVGMSSDVYVRGAKSEQLLVVVDGIEMNDPIGPGRSANFATMDLENVEKIEVLRGAQSSLYGSDAMAGVISITTHRGASGPASGSVSAEAGSFGTYKESADVSGGNDKANYSVSVLRLDSEGISAADEADGNTEKDGIEHTSLSGIIGLTPSDEFGLNFIAKYYDTKTDYDNGGGVGGDASGNSATRKVTGLRGEAYLSLFDSMWYQKLGAAVTIQDRASKDFLDSTFDSTLTKVDWQNDVYLNDANILTAGLEYKNEEGKTDSFSKVSAGTFSVFAQEQLTAFKNLLFTAGGRYDNHDEFGDEFTHKLTCSYLFEETATRIKATYGTAFKAPSLYQLYAPAAIWGAIGNPDLKPEESTGWDAGVEQSLCDDSVILSLTAFATDYKDLIDFTDGYVNQSKVETRGLEAFAKLRLGEKVVAGINYTYTTAENTTTDKDLIRRPKDRVSADVSYDITQKARMNVAVLYVGARDDKLYSSTMFTSSDVRMPSYTVVNLAGSYDINSTVSLFARVDNLFDEDYQEVAGYGTPGISGYGGVKVTL